MTKKDNLKFGLQVAINRYRRVANHNDSSSIEIENAFQEVLKRRELVNKCK